MVRGSNPSGGARFLAPVQTGPGAYPASCTMGTGSFLGVKRPGRGADHPPPSSAEVEGRVELYICSPSGPSWPVIGRTLSLPLRIWFHYLEDHETRLHGLQKLRSRICIYVFGSGKVYAKVNPITVFSVAIKN